MTAPSGPFGGLAAAVREGRRSARTATLDALQRIADCDSEVCAVTRVLRDRALRTADAVDAKLARGLDLGPLAGVPFGVKDLFDVEGLATTAGAELRASAVPATCDAEAIGRLEAAGAVLVATLNMDAFAYGFVTDNAWRGITRNPHDLERFAGGSAAAVAARMLPLTLGSDTNGSIRVPAALCGVYGLKPTHLALPMQGVFPLAGSLDDIGPFATSVEDLRLGFEVLRGSSLSLPPISTLRIGRLGGWFARNLAPKLAAGLERVHQALGRPPVVDLPEVERERSAAYLMTAIEGGALHLASLRTDAMAYDPAVRDRLIAGALLPASVYREVQSFRRWFVEQVEEVLTAYDVLIAPCVGDVAPRIDHPVIEVDSTPVPARRHLGLFTQPLSFAGLPIIAAPLRREGLPLGVQLIGPPGGEAAIFAVAAALEAEGLVGATPGVAPTPSSDRLLMVDSQ